MRKLLVILCVTALLLTSCGPSLEERYPRKYESFVTAASLEFGVPEDIIYAVIKCESDFRPDAVSPVGACGLMQLMPVTYEWLLTYKMKEEYIAENIFDPESNIRTGTCMLKYLYGIFSNWETVFAAYNAGQGTVGGWLADERYSDDGVTLKEIPYGETKQFVNRIKTARGYYIQLYYTEESKNG